MKLDAGFTPVCGIVRRQLSEGAFLIAQRTLFRWEQARDLNRQVTLAELRDGVVVWIRAIEFVRRAALQVQLQLAELRLGNYNRAFRQGELRTVLVPRFPKKNTVPLCPARGDVIDVKYCLGKALVKNARLHLKGNLVGQEVGFDRSKRAQSLRAGPERHNRSDYDAAKRKDRNRNQNSSATDTQGGESDDF